MRRPLWHHTWVPWLGTSRAAQPLETARTASNKNRHGHRYRDARDWLRLVFRNFLASECTGEVSGGCAARLLAKAWYPVERIGTDTLTVCVHRSITASMSGAIGFGREAIEITKNNVSETSNENAPP